MIEENFIKIYEKSFKENWDLPALTDYNTRETFTYGEVAEQIARLHLLFKYCQISIFKRDMDNRLNIYLFGLFFYTECRKIRKVK